MPSEACIDVTMYAEGLYYITLHKSVQGGQQVDYCHQKWLQRITWVCRLHHTTRDG